MTNVLNLQRLATATADDEACSLFSINCSNTKQVEEIGQR